MPRHIRLILAAVFVLALILVATVADTVAPPQPPLVASMDITLPLPRLTGLVSVESVFVARGKVQNFQKKPLALEQISQLAFAVFGPQTSLAGAAAGIRAPEPLVMYFVMDTGVYVYKPAENSLGKVSRGDKRTFLAGVVSSASIRAVSEAPCSIVMTSRGMRPGELVGGSRDTMLIAAGKAAGAVELQALAMGLGTVTCERIGAPQVGETLGLPVDETALCVMVAGYPLSGPVVQPLVPDKGTDPAEPSLKVLLIVPQKSIVDNEYEAVTKSLKTSDCQVVVASADIGTYKTTAGKDVHATLKIGQVDIATFSGVIFLGGPEARQYYQDAAVRRLVLEAVREKKFIAALSTAPRILANAGILAGLNVAVNTTERQAIVKEGGVVTGADMERVNLDGATIITATGAKSGVTKFNQQVFDAMMTPKATEPEKSAGRPTTPQPTPTTPRQGP
jgi:putative intracellular protease/amidase